MFIQIIYLDYLKVGFNAGNTTRTFEFRPYVLVCSFPNDVWVVEGIASYIVDTCAAPNHPAVFTRVYGYLSWIKGITRLS